MNEEKAEEIRKQGDLKEEIGRKEQKIIDQEERIKELEDKSKPHPAEWFFESVAKIGIGTLIGGPTGAVLAYADSYYEAGKMIKKNLE